MKWIGENWNNKQVARTAKVEPRGINQRLLGCQFDCSRAL